MTDHGDAEMEQRRYEAADERADDADDRVTEQTEAATQREVTGEKTGDESDQDPDQDRVEVEMNGCPVERDDHAYTNPLSGITRSPAILPARAVQVSLPASSPRAAPSTRLKAGNGWITSDSTRIGVPTFTARTSSPRISPALGLVRVAPM